MYQNKNISISKAKISDLDFIVAAQMAMAKETENYLLDLNTLTKGVQAVFDSPSKGEYFMADFNSKRAGMLLTIPEWSDWRNGTVLWIHSVYVLPEFRSQGIYKALYLHLKNMVESSTTYRGLRLYVDKRNLKAQTVYQKLGMDNQHYELYEWLK
jgi:ribosomal protein S18 acetylase RimI-like enzyme